MSRAIVLDNRDQPLSSCSEEKALRLLATGKAERVSKEPLTIRLLRQVDVPKPLPEPTSPLQGQRLLLHICCGPCATYTVKRLRELEADVTGHWYNPNIHPFAEYEQRRQSLERLASKIELPMLWSDGYEMPRFFREVAGHELVRERCAICYRLRLTQTAQTAAAGGYAWFSTTLLISPYQDQALIRSLGEELGKRHGVRFYFENLRRGFREHFALARSHDLYMQRYCGCLYSEWEAAQAIRHKAGESEGQVG